MEPADARSPDALADVEAAISAGVARLLAEAGGRGPSRVSCHVHDDYVLLVLFGVMSQAERSLARTGNGELAAETRLTFHETLRPRVLELVEAHTGRGVACTLPQFDQDHDVLTEVLLLDGLDGLEPVAEA